MEFIREFFTPISCSPVSAGLPATASAPDLQFALQSVEEVGRVSVTREGTCSGYSWNIKWRSRCGKQNLLQVPSAGFVLFFSSGCCLLICTLSLSLFFFLTLPHFYRNLRLSIFLKNANSRLNIKKRKLRRRLFSVMLT